jgi:PPOX class probable F420-dependent enzyme
LQNIPQEYLDLLKPETRAFGYLATTMRDGTPQVTVVWFSWDGKFILVNSARGRVKDRNIQEHPAVAILIGDPADPYRFIQIRGKVVGITEDGADELINQLSLQYDGIPWVKVEGQKRVIFKIAPENVTVNG